VWINYSAAGLCCPVLQAFRLDFIRPLAILQDVPQKYGSALLCGLGLSLCQNFTGHDSSMGNSKLVVKREKLLAEMFHALKSSKDCSASLGGTRHVVPAFCFVCWRGRSLVFATSLLKIAAGWLPMVADGN